MKIRPDWKNLFPSSSGQFLLVKIAMSGSNDFKDNTLRSPLSPSLERSCVSQRKRHTCISVRSPGTLRLVSAVEEELKRLEN